MTTRPTHEDNCALARAIKKSRVDGPTLRIAWLASGADHSPPGTYYKAETEVAKLRRVFEIFIPAPANNRATVKLALMNQLEGLTQPRPAIKVREVTP